ncbi:hypothetical protein KsCSTR_27360 [Candidatus Kuenenia stuttgartiensis]|uniref:Uncharacterized protein n=1 Tax=Kuenenia stuttgartiensis TaxID=174633 RepID=A0A6G7GRH9_KUEST|nr:hypothetical protein KsCSTR_27360 [Candidatus Kuenenia stuttgartiensis]
MIRLKIKQKIKKSLVGECHYLGYTQPISVRVSITKVWRGYVCHVNGYCFYF